MLGNREFGIEQKLYTTYTMTNWNNGVWFSSAFMVDEHMFFSPSLKSVWIVERGAEAG